MAGELFKYVVFVKAVEGMMWARNSQELTNNTWLENEFSPKMRGLRFDRELHVEDGDSVRRRSSVEDLWTVIYNLYTIWDTKSDNQFF